MILIVGANGSMGKRYQAILNHLRQPWRGIDIAYSGKSSTTTYSGQGWGEDDITSIIIATPTDDHVATIRKFRTHGLPILCEKPITKNLAELDAILSETKGIPFSMVDQYRFIPGMMTERNGRSEYNYFRHGSDGLAWDCMQIIGLAKGEPELSEDSPLWRCMINDFPLALSQMDYAYLAMIEKWLRDPEGDRGRILTWHQKTHAMAGKLKCKK